MCTRRFVLAPVFFFFFAFSLFRLFVPFQKNCKFCFLPDHRSTVPLTLPSAAPSANDSFDAREPTQKMEGSGSIVQTT